jgi:hypothetical protein
MASLCAQVFRDGSWKLVCMRGDDSADGRRWLLGEIAKEFGKDAPVTLLRLSEDGTYRPVKNGCCRGCACSSASCPGRAKTRNRPPQPHASTRPGRKPPKVGTRVVAEDIDMDEGDGDMGMQEADVPEPMWHGDGDDKPRRDKPTRPADTEAEHHGHVLTMVAALLGHLARVRRGSKEAEALRAELYAAMGNLPRTMAGEALRKDAEHALAVTAPPRASASRRKQFLAWHGIH